MINIQFPMSKYYLNLRDCYLTVPNRLRRNFGRAVSPKPPQTPRRGVPTINTISYTIKILITCLPVNPYWRDALRRARLYGHDGA